MGLGPPTDSMDQGKLHTTSFSTGLNQLRRMEGWTELKSFDFASQLWGSYAPKSHHYSLRREWTYKWSISGQSGTGKNICQRCPLCLVHTARGAKGMKPWFHTLSLSFKETVAQLCFTTSWNLFEICFALFWGDLIHLVAPNFPTQPVYVSTHALRNAELTSAASRSTDASEIPSSWEWYVLSCEGVCVRPRLITTTPFGSSWWYYAIVCGTSNPKSRPCWMPTIFAPNCMKRCSCFLLLIVTI